MAAAQRFSSPAAPRALHARAFDALAMATFPWVARLAGYTFAVGKTPRLRTDAQAVLHDVWRPKGVITPDDVAWVGERFLLGGTWVLAYHRGAPVGVMGLFDPREVSPNLEYNRKRLPQHLDVARTREIARLAVAPAHRGGAQWVMVGLLREMLRWSQAGGVALLLTSATPALFRVYRHFNPTARQVDAPDVVEPEPEPFTRYFRSPRAVTGAQVLFTFEVAGARPWDVFARFLAAALRRRR
jgi:hypothetical protein